MKILFINPYFPYRGKDKFPVGLAYLAAIAKQFGEVFIIDENIQKFSFEQIEKIKPDYVGITSTTPSFSRALQIAEQIKSYNTEIKIIFGGTHVSFNSSVPNADVIIHGEGEETLKEILEGKPLNEIKGITFRHNGKIITNPERGLIADLNAIPNPAYELFNLKKYDIVGVISSRGCPYSCSYCCASRFWKQRVRFRSPEKFIEELRLLWKKGVRKIKIHDSTFTLDKNRAKKICESMIDNEMDFAWSCETRADHLDEELMKLMKHSGCRLVCIGVDSGSQEVLDTNNRKIKVAQMKKLFALVKKIGLRIRAYVTFGLIGESEKTVRETIEFLKQTKPNQIILSLATIYPGTDLFGSSIEMPDNWKRKFKGHGFGSSLYLPESLSREQYKRLADLMWQEIKNLQNR